MTRARHPAERPGDAEGEHTPSGRRRTSRRYDPRSIAPPGKGLADLFPQLHARAIVCLKYPELPLDRIRPGSNLMVEWSCMCGATMARRVNNVTNRGILVCDAHRAAGKSRFEFEVAALLEVGLDTQVHTHHGAPRRDQVDLYLPDYDTAVEIDPYSTHRDRADRDRRRLEHHARRYGLVFRVRDERLPSIDGCPTVPRNSESVVWGRAIGCRISPGTWSEPTRGEVRIATELAAARYAELLHRPPSPSLADRPEIAAEFLENLDVHFQQTPEWISVGSGCLCLWSCPNGHDPYPAPVDRRTGPQATGCPTCGHARAAAVRRRPPVVAPQQTWHRRWSATSSTTSLAPESASISCGPPLTTSAGGDVQGGGARAHSRSP